MKTSNFPALLTFLASVAQAVWQTRWPGVDFFFISFPLSRYEVASRPFAAWMPWHDHACFQRGCFEEILPDDEFSSHSSDSNMSHRVSPCRASSWSRTRRRLSPTCCVCLPAATCTTSVSNSPLQVRISSTQPAAGLRPSVLLTLEVYEIDLEIFFSFSRPSRTAMPGEELTRKNLFFLFFYVLVKYLPVKTWLVSTHILCCYWIVSQIQHFLAILFFSSCVFGAFCGESKSAANSSKGTEKQRCDRWITIPCQAANAGSVGAANTSSVRHQFRPVGVIFHINRVAQTITNKRQNPHLLNSCWLNVFQQNHIVRPTSVWAKTFK